MIDDIKKLLEQEGEPTKEHQALLTHALALMKQSRLKMSSKYLDWDLQDQVYRGERAQDEADKKAADRGQPEKLVVPHTYAQVQTFVSFLFLLYNQNAMFFEFDPSGNEDHGTKQQDAEKIVNRDCKRNQFNLRTFQHLLNIARFGVGIFETGWTKEIANVFVTPPPVEVNILGVTASLQGEPSWQEFVRFEGNYVRNVSPYRFFPDTAYPLVDFQKGRFCASEEEYSMEELYQLQTNGEVAGVEHIPAASVNWMSSRGGTLRSNNRIDNDWRQNFSATNTKALCVVTKVQIKLVPSKFMVDGDEPLGPETFPVMYHLWIANDQRIIRLEPAGTWHGQFSFTVGLFTPDMEQTIADGLADLIYRLQDIMSWFINARISSVRRVIGNRLIINPSVVDTKSLDGEGDIYLRSGTNPLIGEKAVSQLKVQDVTAGHIADVESLSRLMEVVTGVNGNAMGQYAPGRRSATESRNVNAGAAGRMKMHGHLIWEGSYAPLGQQMLTNHRQALSIEQFQRIVGQVEDLEARYAAFKGTPEEVICGDDFFTFDSTLASEKGFMAQSIQELLGLLFQANPMAAQQVTQTMDPVKLVGQVQYLRGGVDISRFNYDPGTMPPPMVMPEQPGVPPQPGVPV